MKLHVSLDGGKTWVVVEQVRIIADDFEDTDEYLTWTYNNEGVVTDRVRDAGEHLEVSKELGWVEYADLLY